MPLVEILSKKAQEKYSDFSDTNLLQTEILESDYLTVTDKKKLMIIKEAYQNYALEELKSRRKIHSNGEAINYVQKYLFNREQEELFVIFLNNKNEILDAKTIFKGDINKSVCSPREIFKEALKLNAVRLIMAHNHPSGWILSRVNYKRII